MTTYYVDGPNLNASDSAPGTASSPLRTITQANILAASGDTVIVRPGVYKEQIVNKASNVKWQGLPGAVLDGENYLRAYGFHLYGMFGCTITGFKFTGYLTAGVMVTGGGGHRITYNDCPTNGSGIKLQPLLVQEFQPVEFDGSSTLAPGPYAYAVTGIVAGAETLPSFALPVTVTAPGKRVMLSWNKMPAATSFVVYGRTGNAGALTKMAIVPNDFGSGFPFWPDDGSVAPDGVNHMPGTTSVNLTPCWVEGNEVAFSISHGIYLYGAIGCFVRGNKSHHNDFHGIALMFGSNNNVVEFNRTFNNKKMFPVPTRIASGIQCDNFGIGTPGSSNNVIQFNRSYNNDDSGIVLYNGSNDCIVRRNICYDNNDHGIDNFGCSGSKIINNTALRNVTAGIQAEGPSYNVRITNNLAIDNGIDSPRTSGNYRMDPQVIPTGVLESNLSYLTVPVATRAPIPGRTNSEITWGNTLYPTLEAFKQAVPSQMIYGVSADPKADEKTRPSIFSPARYRADMTEPGYINRGFTGSLDTDAMVGAFA